MARPAQAPDHWSLRVSGFGEDHRVHLHSLACGRAGAEEHASKRSVYPFPEPQSSSLKTNINAIKYSDFFFSNFNYFLTPEVSFTPRRIICYTLLFTQICIVSNLEGLIRRKSVDHQNLRLMLSP